MTALEKISKNQNLTELEDIIANWQMSFEQTGNALENIRDQKLYQPKYSSFEIYTKERWDMKRRYADYLIESAKVMSLFRQHNCSHLPTCESQVRPLTKLSPGQQLEVWRAILQKAENGAKITAQLISEAVKTIQQQSKPESNCSLQLTPTEKKIRNSIEYLERISIETLQEFIFSNNDKVLNLHIQTACLSNKFKMLELEQNNSTNSIVLN